MRAIGDFRGTAVLEGRLVRVHGYDAADRIAAEERALRAFQDLNPVQVVHIRLHVGDAYSHYIVDVRADGRIGSRRVVKDNCAAQREVTFGTAARHVNEAGREPRYVRQIDDMILFDGRGTEHGNRDRCLLQIGLPPRRRDDYFLESLTLQRAGVLRARGNALQRSRAARQEKSQKT